MFKNIFLVFIIFFIAFFLINRGNIRDNVISDKTDFVETEFRYLNEKKFEFRDENQKRYMLEIDNKIKATLDLFEKGYYNTLESDSSSKLDKAQNIFEALMKESFVDNDAKSRYFYGKLLSVQKKYGDSEKMLQSSIKLKDNDFFPWNREWAEKAINAVE